MCTTDQWYDSMQGVVDSTTGRNHDGFVSLGCMNDVKDMQEHMEQILHHISLLVSCSKGTLLSHIEKVKNRVAMTLLLESDIFRCSMCFIMGKMI